MLPDIWGSSGWDFFHYVTMGYPDNPNNLQKKQYATYINDLQYVLPCIKCQVNMTSHLKKFPLTEYSLQNRQNLVRWGIDLHNIVNYYINKPMLSYAEAVNSLNEKISQKKKNRFTIWHFLTIFLLVIILTYFFYWITSKHKKIE